MTGQGEFPHRNHFSYAVVSSNGKLRLGSSESHEAAISNIRDQLNDHASFALHFSAHPEACIRLGITQEQIEAEFQAADNLLLSTLGITFRDFLDEKRALELYLNSQDKPDVLAAQMGIECIRAKPAGSR